MLNAAQLLPAEAVYDLELRLLAAWDHGSRPGCWQLTPRAAVIVGGPHAEALVPSPVRVAMRSGSIARIEEVTRCLPEVQDALISILSERRMSVPELTGPDGTVYAQAGFNVIATANLRDRGVSEMSAALKRRFNFELVEPIADFELERRLVERQATAAPARVRAHLAVATWGLDAPRSAL